MAKNKEPLHPLAEEEKQELLRVARSTIFNAIIGRKLPLPETKYPVLQVPRGAFVTLRVRGELRGCIGTIEAVKPLVATVAEMAEAAALHDPRFRPVRIDEVPDLQIEISVLSPLSPVTDIETIQVGTHGLMVERGYFSGLLLPQVAVENEWDPISFLQHTCLKAGLPMEAWKDPEIKIYSFTAEVFAEKQDDSLIVS